MSNIMRLRCRSIIEPDKPCDQLAKALILTVGESVIDGEDEIRAFPVCDGHAPGEAHEVASSMSDDEYVLVELPVFGVGFLS